MYSVRNATRSPLPAKRSRSKRSLDKDEVVVPPRPCTAMAQRCGMTPVPPETRPVSAMFHREKEVVLQESNEYETSSLRQYDIQNGNNNLVLDEYNLTEVSKSQKSREAINVKVATMQLLLDGITQRDAKQAMYKKLELDEDMQDSKQDMDLTSSHKGDRNMFDFIKEKPPLENEEAVLGSDPMEDFFNADEVLTSEKGTAELIAIVHTLHSHIESIYKSSIDFAKQNLVSLEHDYNYSASTALTSVRRLWKKLATVLERVDEQVEQIASLKHMMQILQEKTGHSGMKLQDAKIKALCWKVIAKWRKHVIWRTKICKIEKVNEEEVSEVQEQGREMITAVMLSVEDMEEIKKVDCNVHGIWADLLQKCCYHAEGKLLTQGTGSAKGRGYALVQFKTTQLAVQFALQMQAVLLWTPWSEKVKLSDICNIRYTSDVEEDTTAHQNIMYHLSEGEPNSFDIMDLRNYFFEPIKSSMRKLQLCGPRLRAAVHTVSMLHDSSGVYGKDLMKCSLVCGRCRAGEVMLSSDVYNKCKGWLKHESVYVSKHFVKVPPASTMNWREVHKYQPLPNFGDNDPVYALQPFELVHRVGLLPEMNDLYQQQRLAYNPYWWLPFCNTPPDRWMTTVRSDEPVTDKLPIYEKMLMQMYDIDGHTTREMTNRRRKGQRL
eukprot:TRINITY_DN5868_c0_g1_i4.p1 TRINITY_DN5868_c0_g1~~TRINITY_DN5868_c0_g1_i4.p1  ORF type:complete len:663 (+),score=167.75 TRINITY_DN5868_c0_g1_i4:809-2797(+)